MSAIADQWLVSLRDWLQGQVPSGWGNFQVQQQVEDGARLTPGLQVIHERSERQMVGMEKTERCHAMLVLRMDHDATTAEAFRAHTQEVESWLRTLYKNVNPGPLSDVKLHFFRIEDHVRGENDGDRVGIWKVAAMVTLLV